MKKYSQIIYIILGPLAFLVCMELLSDVLSANAAKAIGILIWCILWWITRPIHIAVTGLVPVIANAIFTIAPMGTLTSQYSSASIILIFGSGLLTIPWSKIGLDQRLALKLLSLIGPSMKSQIVVWLLAAVILSIAMPNVAVCALLTPIAASMLHAAGYDDLKKAAPAVPVFLCIGWGAGIGGAGSPIGGAMNLAAIQYLEEFIGSEFMYVDWLLRLIPYFIISIVILMIYMLRMPLEVRYLEGTKDYFSNSYKELGSMKKDEVICLGLFLLAMLSAFARPLFVELLPGLEPAYIFLGLGALTFFIPSAIDKKPLISWEDAQNETLWGMMVLFGGGLALGSLVNESGASVEIAKIITSLNLDGGLTTIILFTIIARLISEFTNSTTSAAVMIPIVLSFTSELGLNPIPYWFICVMAYNAEFVLPISVRAIPVAYGLDSNIMFKRGIPITIISMVSVVIVGWVCLNFWEFFGQLPGYTF